jgi:hypothetical protein
MKLGMHIMAPEPISTAYFINPTHQSMCRYVYPLIVARKRLGKDRYRGKGYIRNNRRIAGRVVSYAIRLILRKAGD